MKVISSLTLKMSLNIKIVKVLEIIIKKTISMVIRVSMFDISLEKNSLI